MPFYAKLGLKLIVESLPDYARFEYPDGYSTFSIHRKGGLPKGEGISIYFECTNLDEYLKGLIKKGFFFEQTPTNQKWFWREARLKGVDGNQLILFYGGKKQSKSPLENKKS